MVLEGDILQNNLQLLSRDSRYQSNGSECVFVCVHMCVCVRY